MALKPSPRTETISSILTMTENGPQAPSSPYVEKFMI